MSAHNVTVHVGAVLRDGGFNLAVGTHLTVYGQSVPASNNWGLGSTPEDFYIQNWSVP